MKNILALMLMTMSPRSGSPLCKQYSSPSCHECREASCMMFIVYNTLLAYIANPFDSVTLYGINLSFSACITEPRQSTSLQDFDNILVNLTKAAFTPGHICCRIQVVSTCRRRHVSYIGDKIVASLSPVCCWIQRDTSRP